MGKHLVAAGGLIDTDPEAALVHARYAKAKASRVPIVREALGLVSYHAGNWAEALSELRAVRRMTRTDTHIAVIADAERALGRPERALDLAKEAAGTHLPREVEVELRIVAAGARRDMGQLDAAVVSLQGPDLNATKRDPWSARLFYAYADNLAAAGRRDEAIEWFLNAAQADEEDETDAADRAADLSNDDLPADEGAYDSAQTDDVVADRDPEVLNEALAEDLEDEEVDAPDDGGDEAAGDAGDEGEPANGADDATVNGADAGATDPGDEGAVTGDSAAADEATAPGSEASGADGTATASGAEATAGADDDATGGTAGAAETASAIGAADGTATGSTDNDASASGAATASADATASGTEAAGGAEEEATGGTATHSTEAEGAATDAAASADATGGAAATTTAATDATGVAAGKSHVERPDGD
ncbi:hypothetical protein LWP59_12005 [Amycolatopsis acidiphila]|uniref:hypothetical protein n=1 Tax=Amycolatopsis acidiphila TaxID=715473 RepID=UPI001E2A6818|nr:hypothetical protein [Amycolatopsis acidiphila]UIJ62281.1 hypothetical protein LWP59_12005 [Amycolatopsis acidiphila]